jgi:MYXO-CTERM domain-containing protein
MKKLTKVFNAAFICCLLATAPSMTFAQEQNNTSAQADDDDDDKDYGWIGLIGLAGLLGLRKRDRDDRDVNRPANRV